MTTKHAATAGAITFLLNIGTILLLSAGFSNWFTFILTIASVFIDTLLLGMFLDRALGKDRSDDNDFDLPDL